MLLYKKPLIFLVILSLSLNMHVFAEDMYPVNNLPADNLIQNPWFSDKENNCVNPALFPWISVPALNTHSWTASNKPSNPNPPDGCYTAGRISTGRVGGGQTVQPDQDVQLYQVVSANNKNLYATFDMYWVTHTLNKGLVEVYGSNTADPNGTWTKVWTPFSYAKSAQVIPPKGESQEWLWKCYSEHLALCSDAPKLPISTVLEKGYPYYKIVFTFNLPAGSGGFKHTGIYFSVNNNGAPTPVEPIEKAIPQPKPLVDSTSNPIKAGDLSILQKIFLFIQNLFTSIKKLVL